MDRKFTFILIFLCLLVASCVPLAGTIEVGVETPAASETLETREPETPTINETPESSETSQPVSDDPPGIVSGQVCYPSEFIPAMTAYFVEIGTGDLTEIPIAENQSTYTVELPAGAYHAFAWVEAFQIGGAYTAYVACGYAETCTDHALQAFDVTAGQSRIGIDLCDWPVSADQLPLPSQGSETSHVNGIVYGTQDGAFYQFDANGNAVKLFGAQGMALSPDGSLGVYPQNNDLLVLNLTTGEQFNLTNTPNIVEILYQWPVQGKIFFTALPQGEEGGPGATGGLYSIQPDGTGLTIIDGETNAANFAVSPDGRFVAYGAGPTAHIYDLELGQRGVFDPAIFGLSSASGLGISSPSWSPDGQKLAWMTQGDFSGQGAFAVVVYNLSATTYEMIHPYQILGMDGFLPPAQFSPDGNWVSFQAFEQEPNRNGIWVASVGDPQQSTEFFLGSFTATPYWNPDGQTLIYHQYIEAEQGQRVFLYDRNTSIIQQLTQFPPNAFLLGWVPETTQGAISSVSTDMPQATTPEDAILILEPGPGSRLTSPLHVAGFADSTFEQNLVIRVVLDDGTELALAPTIIQAELGQRGPFAIDIPFTITGERQAFIQVYATSARDGGITHLSSVGITLSETGPVDIRPVTDYSERINIYTPVLGATVSGGIAHVEGFALASFEQHLVVEVYDMDGNLIGFSPVTVTAPDLGIPGPFMVDVPYSVVAAGPGRIVVRDPSAAFEGDVHLSSVEVMLSP